MSFPAGATPVSIAVADLDKDNALDLAVVNGGSHHVSVLLGDGHDGFGSPMAFPSGENPASVKAADFDGDGIIDLAVANAGDSTVSVLFGSCSR